MAMGGLTMEEIHEELVLPYFQGAEGEEAPYRPVMEGVRRSTTSPQRPRRHYLQICRGTCRLP